MELKRYVLGIEKGIIDTKGTEYYIWERNKLCSGGGGVLDIILKTSDNILDLVEVGDLTEQSYKGQNFLQRIDDNFDLQKYEDDLKEGNGIYYVSIYKLQPNGDYKRYEVKE